MSIKSEVAKTASYLRSARKAILGRGGEISLTAGLKDLPNAIYKIPPDASLAYQTDDSVAYQKIVPSGAEEFAQVSKIGGMTYKCKNLFDIETWLTNCGATWSKENNKYTINFRVSLYNQVFTLSPTDTSVTVAGLFSDITSANARVELLNSNGEVVFSLMSGTESKTGVGCAIRFDCSTSGTFTIEAPMVNLGSTALPYEPYFEGLRDTKVTELISEGASLFDISQIKTTTLSYGVYNEGDSLRIVTNADNSGTATYYNNTLKDLCPNVKVGETYTINANSTGSNKYIYLLGAKQRWNFGTSLTITEQMYKSTIIFYASGVSTTATISEIMINKGSTVAPYKPYRSEAVDTFAIPEAIQALDGYGEGIEGYLNYIDFDRKVFVQNVSPFVFKGTEQWQKNAEAGDYWSFYISTSYYTNYLGSDSMTTSVHICNKFPSTSWKDTKQGEFAWWAKASVGIRLHKSRLPNYENLTDNTGKLNAFKEWLKSQYDNGNPVIWIWALAEPIETDISEYLTNSFIAVEGDGTITAVNEHNSDVPSTINYITKVGT